MGERWNPDEYLADWTDAVGVIQAFMPHILQHTELKSGFKVLELGTGSGKWAVAFTLLGCYVTAVDNMPEMLERVRQNFPSIHRAIHLVKEDALTLKSFPEQTYDVVCSEGLYEHWLDLETRKLAVTNWYWKLKKTGVCIIMVPFNNVADDEVYYPTAKSLVEEINEFHLFAGYGAVILRKKDDENAGMIILVCKKTTDE